MRAAHPRLLNARGAGGFRFPSLGLLVGVIGPILASPPTGAHSPAAPPAGANLETAVGALYLLWGTNPPPSPASSPLRNQAFLADVVAACAPEIGLRVEPFFVVAAPGSLQCSSSTPALWCAIANGQPVDGRPWLLPCAGRCDPSWAARPDAPLAASILDRCGEDLRAKHLKRRSRMRKRWRAYPAARRRLLSVSRDD